MSFDQKLDIHRHAGSTINYSTGKCKHNFQITAQSNGEQINELNLGKVTETFVFSPSPPPLAPIPNWHFDVAAVQSFLPTQT